MSFNEDMMRKFAEFASMSDEERVGKMQETLLEMAKQISEAEEIEEKYINEIAYAMAVDMPFEEIAPHFKELDNIHGHITNMKALKDEASAHLIMYCKIAGIPLV